MYCLLLSLCTVLHIASGQPNQDKDGEAPPLLYDLEVKCEGSTGRSAVLSVAWRQASGPQPAPSAPRPGGVLAPTLGGLGTFSSLLPHNSPRPIRHKQPGRRHKAGQKSLQGTLLLLGEFSHFDKREAERVDLAKEQATLNVPQWALETGVFASVMLKQGESVVGRVEFVQLAAVCGHGREWMGDVEAVNEPFIGIN